MNLHWAPTLMLMLLLAELVLLLRLEMLLEICAMVDVMSNGNKDGVVDIGLGELLAKELGPIWIERSGDDADDSCNAYTSIAHH